MWRPGNVVEEHRKRATLVWAALLLAILGYIAWQIATITDKYDHPSTSFSVSDDPYPFPPLLVCVWNEQGCDTAVGEEVCIATASFTLYDSCNQNVSSDWAANDINVASEFTNCLQFDLGQLDMDGFESGCIEGAAFRKPSMAVTLSWIESFFPSDEDFVMESIGIFLGNGSTQEYSRVPYSRVFATPETALDGTPFVNTYFTIGKNVRTLISGDSTASYPILTLSTIDNLDNTRTVNSSSGNSTYALGYAHITLTQGSYSLTELTDIDPFDPAALLGNIGGFWEILLVTWGLCFIATREQAPTQKGRDFSQPLQMGRDIVARKRRSLQPTVYSDSECYGEEERPHWDPAARARRQGVPGGDSIRAIPSVNVGSVGGVASDNDSSAGGPARQQGRGSRRQINVAASFFRRPIPQDLPRRSFSQPSQSAATGEPSAAGGKRGTARQQDVPPSYADCA